MADDFEELAEAGSLEALDEGETVEAEPKVDEDAEFESLAAESEEEAPEAEAKPEPKAKAEGEEEEADPWAKYLRDGEQGVEDALKDRDHQAKRADAHYSELKEIKEQLKAQQPQLEAAKRVFEAMQKQQEERLRREIEDELPDPELEPEKYTQAQIKALREQISMQEYERHRQQQEQLTQQQQQAQQQALRQVDEQGFHEISSNLGLVDGSEADPEFQEAFNNVSQIQYETIKNRYPDATEEKLAEALNLVQRLEIRRAAQAGVPVTDLYKHSYAVFRKAMGLTGQQQPQQKNGKGGKPTAREIEKAAKQAEKGGGIRRRTGSGSVAAPQSFEDFAALPEHEQAKLLSSGEVAEDELWGELASEWG